MKTSSHVRRIPHITICVSDVKTAVSFYQGILGLEKIGEWPGYAQFDIAGVGLGLERRPKPEICLLVDDVDKAYAHLKDKGVKFVSEPKDQSWGARAATFLDPDGNMLVIESFECKVCGKICDTYRELLEEHLRRHKRQGKEQENSGN